MVGDRVRVRVSDGPHGPHCCSLLLRITSCDRPAQNGRANTVGRSEGGKGGKQASTNTRGKFIHCTPEYR